MHINPQLLADLNVNPYTILETLSIKEIVQLLTQANHAYHQEGRPLFSDSIYEIIRAYLQKLVPDHPLVQNDIGADVPKKDRVKLPVFMGSQNKIKEDPSKWVQKYSGSYVISDKLDGISCLFYKHNNTVTLYTRGDGYYGQDITHLLKYIQGVPNMDTRTDYIVRGELIFTKTNWNSLKDTYKNPRNTVAGIANSKHPDPKVAQYIHFVAYEVVQPQLKPSTALTWLESQGFNVVNYVLANKENMHVDNLSSILVKRRSNGPYEIDGIVISHDALHTTPTHANPEYSFAFKSIITMEKVEVVVKNIEWNVSKHGLLKPVVIFDSVYISGVHIHRASGHNAKFIDSNCIGPGSHIVIIRSGDVIPYIQEVLSVSSSGTPLMPDSIQFPWKWNDTHVEIVLKNPHLADDYHLKQLHNYISIFNIKGLGAKIIKRLYTNGIDTIKKLVNITKTDLYRATHSSKITMKIYSQMQKVYTSALCFDFMAASNIFGNGFGRAKFQLIVTAFPSVLQKDSIMPTLPELLTTKGLGERYARQFLEHIDDFHDFMETAGLQCRSLDMVYMQPNSGEMALQNKTIVFTGFRSKELEEFIIKRGGKVSTSVSNNTSILVIKIMGDQGLKAELANEMGIPIITLSEFQKDIGFVPSDADNKKARRDDSSEDSEFRKIREKLEEEGLYDELDDDNIDDNVGIQLTTKAECVRQTLNWSGLKRNQVFGKHSFDVDEIVKNINQSSPKLQILLNKISDLDARDMQKYGKHFKHMIFSDVKYGYGAKIVAGALESIGFNHAYNSELYIDMRDLEKNKGYNFAVLAATQIYTKPITMQFKQRLLSIFNNRPTNIHGDSIRIIVLDGGYKEGIDLFDIKYVHLYEPFLTYADEQQAIGRATRFCGQKGLDFDATRGWKLHVYKYEHILKPEYATEFDGSSSYEIIRKEMKWNANLVNLTKEIEHVSLEAAVDRKLTAPIHKYTHTPPKQGLNPDETQSQINLLGLMSSGGDGGTGSADCGCGKKNGGGCLSCMNAKYGGGESVIDLKKYKWPPVKMENLCQVTPANTSSSVLAYSPTQDFIRNYFVPNAPHKGIFLWHSLGSGKTCTALATASTEWEAEGYTILWVTRGTLRSDVYKNMFDMSCIEKIRDYLKKGHKIPEVANMAARKRLLAKSWVPPISYRQFNNTLQKQNRLYDFLIKKNGYSDPFKKTLLIIDEAHLMLSSTMKEADKPDVDLLKTWLRHSYNISGNDSARIMLMSATPITNDPFAFSELMNLTSTHDMPYKQDTFIKAYLNKDSLQFTDSGKKKFMADVKGRISYLNRTKDVRQFAQPVIRNVDVPISEVLDVSKYVTHIAEKQKELDNLKEIKLRDLVDKESELIDITHAHELETCESIEDKKLKKACIKNIKDKTVELKAKAKEKAKDTISTVKDKIVMKKAEIKTITKEMKLLKKNDTSIVNVLRKTCYKKPKEKRKDKGDDEGNDSEEDES